MEFEKIDEKKAVINKILERKNYLKRPKVSNITKVVFVISPKMPKVNLNMLDKKLCFAEFLELNVLIVINKIDLDEEESRRIQEIYENSGYKVIKTNAEKGLGIEELKEELRSNTSVLAGESGVRKI